MKLSYGDLNFIFYPILKSLDFQPGIDFDTQFCNDNKFHQDNPMYSFFNLFPYFL